jgi:hypothetical protein
MRKSQICKAGEGRRAGPEAVKKKKKKDMMELKLKSRGGGEMSRS